ncbi:hypothetical protein MRB53_041644 [Persea americana]|nr:hypothetical protein MRB53_041644 [Persea americana]
MIDTIMEGDNLPVFFFDIDNCARALAFTTDLTRAADYGLAIEGLVRHHKVDPLEYNSKVDDALPLEEVIAPDPALRRLLEDLDTSKVRPWLFTNAYITHGKRVVALLGVSDLFQGITYCDYGAESFVCKPHRAMFAKAQKEAGCNDPARCFFVGQRSTTSR